MQTCEINRYAVWKDVSRDPMHKYNKYKNMSSIEGIIKYIMMDKQTGNRVRFCGGTGVNFIFFNEAHKQMKLIKKYYKKLSGRQVWHYILSFPIKPSDKTVFNAYKISLELTNTCFKDYQSLFAVHEDTDNLHVHFLLNSVSFRDGRKWHLTDWESNALENYTDQVARKYFTDN